jgi:DNA modification methylase
MQYEEFVAAKAEIAPKSGFDPGDEISDVLFPFQRDIVRWACIGGRRAIFAAFGLGKSLMQLELMRLVGNHMGGRQLIVCPLGVRQEFKRDAEMLGLEPVFVRHTLDVGGEGLYLTNYESVRDGKLDLSLFDATTLDEASVLRSYGSKTYQTFLDKFKDVPYRFVATATPSPNRHKELIHYAGYLGIMKTGDALTRFFQRDSTKANNLTLYPHREREFWLWLASWAVFVQRPSDLGYSDEGYDLPELDVRWHRIETPTSDDYMADRDGQTRMFVDATLSVSDASRAKRDTMGLRVAKAKELIDEAPNDHFVLWHDLEAERHEIKKAIPEVVEVYGSQDLEERERRIVAFSDGESRILATKPILSGSGCNFQRFCHREIFVGIGFKFNDFIQSIHRVQRFQQTERVRIDIIYADTEENVVRVLKQKWKQHEELTKKMEEIIRKYGLADATIAEALKVGMGVKRIQADGEGWVAVNNDTVQETRRMPDDSVDLIVTSIPFSKQYQYSNNYCDFGMAVDNEEFFNQMDYLTPELLRVLKPGRIACIHTKDGIDFGNVTGKGLPTVYPFHSECIQHYTRHGFDYLGMITIVTDVVRENNQTYRLGWSEACKDMTKMGVGSPEYVLILHKPQTDRSRGYADVPVTHSKDAYSRARWQVDAHAFWRDGGNRPLTSEEIELLSVSDMSKAFRDMTLSGVYDYESHVRIGEDIDGVGHLPSTFMCLAPASWAPDVWTDINRMLTLNTSQKMKGKEQHLCPLQYQTVERLIERYSNPGELVFDPFGGLMTVPYMAMKMGRKGRGHELNTQYFMDGVAYLKALEAELSMPTLFDVERIA